MAQSSPKSQKQKPAPKVAKLIDKYHAALKEFAYHNVLNESGTRRAFEDFLVQVGRQHKWTLVAGQEKKVNGRSIYPDGMFKDDMNLVRGYWEAKDTDDNLDAEIAKKRKAGYPTSNIIFEDTATAVLLQHDREILRVDMKDSARLAELLTEFFRYVEPEIEEFEQAVSEFKQRVPDLAEGLKKKIEQAHKSNKAFKQAFADFFELCRTSLNPNLSEAAVDEMLIQHILTERLIREIFDNPEFVRRNVIAAEVEKVMVAMTSQSFDRTTYLRELDRFYVAIEHAARTMTDFSDKQHFLNTVYERFFQGYSVKLADTMGIVYTPQEIVDFMCASVEEVLENEFGKKLWSDDVYIIDPCTGTGNFIVNLIRRIPKAKLEDVYKHRLFANEIMLLPYYIAALNIEHAYYEQLGRYEAFEGLCFVDTLELVEQGQTDLAFMTEANTRRVQRQRKSPITVVIGNPPWNAKQQDENDNNKNRRYPGIDARMRATYIGDSTATNKNSLNDMYLRFFRWASDRLTGREGIVAFVSNNGFFAGKAADGVRKQLLRDFRCIYHFGLKGDARTTGERRRDEGGNVFHDQIRAGVAITLLVKHSAKVENVRYCHFVPDQLGATEKLAYLRAHASCARVPWKQFVPDRQGHWNTANNQSLFATFVPMAIKNERIREVIFGVSSIGVKTNRDEVAYDFSDVRLEKKILSFAESYNSEVDRFRRSRGTPDVDSFVDYSKVKWSRDLKQDLRKGKYVEYAPAERRLSAYRPFTKKWVYFDRVVDEEVYWMPRFFPKVKVGENSTICVTGHPQIAFMAQITTVIPNEAVGGRNGQCFPFYVYDEDGSNRRENITGWALKHFREHYTDKKIDKWAIFHYVYGLLHHPGYREKFADNLKRELPRIPLAPDFWAFSKAGRKLAALHLDYEKLKPWPLKWIETPGEPLSYRVEDKMRLTKEKTVLTVNSSLRLGSIPGEAFDYRLGNRSALEWVIDQYQVYTDPRSGITSDPNREEDPEYIVRLVGQVIRVSLETMKIVGDLPAEYCEAVVGEAV